MVDEDGFSVREKYEGLIERARDAKRRAVYEAELSCPPLPAALSYLWTIYRRLRRRKGGGFGPQPIEWTDIDAFLRRAHVALASWEIEVIEDIDDLFLMANASKKSPPKSDKT